MKNWFKELERITQGYNRTSLSARFLGDVREKTMKRAVREKIEELEKEIITASKFSETCLIKRIRGHMTETDTTILDQTLTHFEEQGFMVVRRDLAEIGDPGTKYFILSWHGEK